MLRYGLVVLGFCAPKAAVQVDRDLLSEAMLVPLHVVAEEIEQRRRTGWRHENTEGPAPGSLARIAAGMLRACTTIIKDVTPQTAEPLALTEQAQVMAIYGAPYVIGYADDPDSASSGSEGLAICIEFWSCFWACTVFFLEVVAEPSELVCRENLRCQVRR